MTQVTDIFVLVEQLLGTDINLFVVTESVPAGYGFHHISHKEAKRGDGLGIIYRSGLSLTMMMIFAIGYQSACCKGHSMDTALNLTVTFLIAQIICSLLRNRSLCIDQTFEHCIEDNAMSWVHSSMRKSTTLDNTVEMVKQVNAICK